MIWFAILATLAPLLVAGIRRIDSVPPGLHADYFKNDSWRAPAAISRVEVQPGSSWPTEEGRSLALDPFSVAWRGYLYAPRNGTYVIASMSRGEVHVHIGHEAVVHAGSVDLTLAQGTVRLSQGGHQVIIRARQPAGTAQVQLLWGLEGANLTPIPSSAFATRRVSMLRFRVARTLDASLIGLQWLWAAAMFTGLVSLVRWGFGRIWREHDLDPVLRWIVAASIVLNTIGIWWGVPRERRWVPDELTPWTTIDAINARFAGGWFDAYPPFHNVILSIVYGPLLVLGGLGRMDFESPTQYAVLTIVGRLVSVVMAAGTVVAIYVCAKLVANRRAGLFAAASVALTAPFLYYAKTINVDVPYLFWFAISMVCFLRALTRQYTRDFIWFGVTMALAISTKDQAYGLYVLTPIPLIIAIWRARQRAGEAIPLWRAIVDRHVLIAGGTALAVFIVAQNLVFNFVGFQKHLDYLQDFSRVTDSVLWTPSGRLELAAMTARQIRQALGWVLSVITAGGVVLALREPSLRRYVWWLAVPVISYYLTFINVVGFSYDRFMLPVCLLLAIFGGVLLDKFTRRGVALRPWRIALVCVLLGHSLAYSAAVDVLMVFDARYHAERWLTETVKVGESVGVAGVDYMPLTRQFHAAYVGSVDDLERARPQYVVINADSLRLARRDSTPGLLVEALDRGAFGYERVYQYRERLPWSWVPGMHPVLVGDHRPHLVLSNLHHINPLIEIYRRGS